MLDLAPPVSPEAHARLRVFQEMKLAEIENEKSRLEGEPLPAGDDGRKRIIRIKTLDARSKALRQKLGR